MKAPGAAAEWVDTASLKPWKGNPRKNQPVDLVVKSIERFGFSAPIIARTANREIIAGHTRWKAAKKLSLSRVPVRFMDIDEAKAHELALMDNRAGEMADWDDDELSSALASMDEEVKAMLDASEPESSSREDLEVQEVDVSDAVGATFWMTVRGPLPSQPDAIERLRAALEALPGVTVELGGMA